MEMHKEDHIINIKEISHRKNFRSNSGIEFDVKSIVLVSTSTAMSCMESSGYVESTLFSMSVTNCLTRKIADTYIIYQLSKGETNHIKMLIEMSSVITCNI